MLSDGALTHDCKRLHRASKDSQGVGKGVWRERYQGVRAASMLLALFNLNKHLDQTAVQQLKDSDLEAPQCCPGTASDFSSSLSSFSCSSCTSSRPLPPPLLGSCCLFLFFHLLLLPLIYVSLHLVFLFPVLLLLLVCFCSSSSLLPLSNKTLSLDALSTL